MYLLNSNDPLDKSPDSHDGDSMRRRFKPRAASTQTPPRASLESSLPKCGSSSYTSSSRPAKRKTLPRPRRGQATYYGLSSAHGGVLRRSWAPPLALILVFICAYALDPSDANIVSHFLFLSYRLDSHQQHQQHDGGGGRSSSFSSSTPQYGKGPWDLAFVCFYTVVLSFAREFVTQEVLRPAARACGIRSRAKQSRFMEQMYTACYVAVVAGPLGLYVMEQQQQQWHASSTPSALTTTAGPLPTLSFWHGFLGETKAMYESYPHRTHGAVFKCYYLLQAAFWAQQVLVMALGLEKRRSDFREFVAHHVVTVALIWLSYRFHFTHMGVAVYVTHDVSDFFLAVSPRDSGGGGFQERKGVLVAT